MIKYIFVIILGGCCAAIGFMYSERLRQRVCLLDALRSSLKQAGMLISYSAITLSEIAKRLSTLETVGGLWKQMQLKLEANCDVQMAWEEALAYERSSGGSVCTLREDELLIMNEFIAQFGKSDRENQIANIEMALERLGVIYEQALEEQRKKGRMYRSVGLLSALAIIVLCW